MPLLFERGNKLRLLFCNACKTLEELPNYDGKDEVDPYVEQIVFKHNERDPMSHGGDHLKASPIRIYVVLEKEWSTNRAGVLKLINNENRKVGLDAEVSEAMNTYSEDALRCFSDHHRPQQGCIDYWDESKRIGRPTEEGRAARKSNPKLGETDPHLCQFCPVHTFVTTERRYAAGMYS